MANINFEKYKSIFSVKSIEDFSLICDFLDNKIVEMENETVSLESAIDEIKSIPSKYAEGIQRGFRYGNSLGSFASKNIVSKIIAQCIRTFFTIIGYILGIGALIVNFIMNIVTFGFWSKWIKIIRKKIHEKKMSASEADTTSQNSISCVFDFSKYITLNQKFISLKEKIQNFNNSEITIKNNLTTKFEKINSILSEVNIDFSNLTEALIKNFRFTSDITEIMNQINSTGESNILYNFDFNNYYSNESKINEIDSYNQRILYNYRIRIQNLNNITQALKQQLYVLNQQNQNVDYAKLGISSEKEAMIFKNESIRYISQVQLKLQMLNLIVRGYTTIITNYLIGLNSGR